jgi:hypothetical protein
MRRIAASPLLIAVLAAAGCGSGQSTARPTVTIDPPGPPKSPGRVVLRTPDRDLRRRGRSLELTSVLPRSVRRACAKAADRSREVVYCPPLVPIGAALVAGVDGVLRSRDFRRGFVANFLSRSVRPSRSAPGHWTLAEGDLKALRGLLHPRDYDPHEGAIRRRSLRIDHAWATLRLMPSFRIFHGIYGGHAVVSWACAGREYQLSMHGHGNAGRAILMATALARELPRRCGHAARRVRSRSAANTKTCRRAESRCRCSSCSARSRWSDAAMTPRRSTATSSGSAAGS